MFAKALSAPGNYNKPLPAYNIRQCTNISELSNIDVPWLCNNLTKHLLNITGIWCSVN